MELYLSDQSLVGIEKDLPMSLLSHDWHGRPVPNPPSYALVRDPEHLWLVATRQAPAVTHPNDSAGDFIEGLWEYDVAECFIAAPDGSHYLEFNLGPHGAWWCCAFSAPRVRQTNPHPLEGVLTKVKTLPDGGWWTALGIPLKSLEKMVEFGPESTLNVTMILQSPDERFLTACDLGGGEPDYHRPQRFERPDWLPM